jgi:hypothetical protein
VQTDDGGIVVEGSYASKALQSAELSYKQNRCAASNAVEQAARHMTSQFVIEVR